MPIFLSAVRPPRPRSSCEPRWRPSAYRYPGLARVRRLTREQKSEAADAFGAEGAFLSAGKKLVDTSHPALKAVTAVRGRILALWKASSLPYPESGVRLIRQDRVEEFNARMQELREELGAAVERLDEHFAELKSAARQRLGRLFNPADYPDSLRLAVEWDFPNVDAPFRGTEPHLPGECGSRPG